MKNKEVSELLKAKGFGVVKSSFPLYEKPDPNKENEWIISDDELMALQNQTLKMSGSVSFAKKRIKRWEWSGDFVLTLMPLENLGT